LIGPIDFPEAKAHQAEGATMRFIFFIRTLLFALVMLCLSAASLAQVGVAITFGPPALPVYEQPLCPGDGYIWTPGYWAYDYSSDDYYWVPGTWVMAPEVGFLWTPAYWAWGGDRFNFYEGYWGPHVGFYGGINYGFGYFGEGYQGGRWDNGYFFYNRSVNNVNINEIHNVYNTPFNNNRENRVSYNGGNGGVNARATSEEEAAAHERHIGPAAVQTQHEQGARANPQQRASVNTGRPPIAATPRPGDYNDRGTVAAKEAGAPYTPANRGGNQVRSENAAARPSTVVHPHDLPPVPRPGTPNTGNPNLDKKYQQQQEQQVAKQQQERDKLQQKQDQEHQKLAKQNANEGAKQQVEQKHQQQTQQMVQKHTQQQQQLQTRQQSASQNSAKPPRGKG